MAAASAARTVRLVLWRHGQTAWNAERRFQGQSDVPLNETGRAQARRAARYLAALDPDVIVSSDLARATQTAAPLAALTGLPVQTYPGLRERHGGLWEGLNDAEIRARFPAEHAAWTPPGGESTAEVADRASAVLRRVAGGLSDGALAVVVGHGASLGMAAARLLGLPERDRVLGVLANCAWSVLGCRDGSWRLLEHNVGMLPDPVPDPGDTAVCTAAGADLAAAGLAAGAGQADWAQRGR